MAGRLISAKNWKESPGPSTGSNSLNSKAALRRNMAPTQRSKFADISLHECSMSLKWLQTSKAKS